MSTVTPETITSVDRKLLLKELQALGELSQYPAIYTSKSLSAEIQRERQEIITRLRDLPLAG